MKSRSSTGVGQKIDLDYNIDTMRITDSDPEGHGQKTQSQPSATDIMAKIRATSTIGAVNELVHETIDPNTGEIEAVKRVVPDVQSAKLKSLLNSLKK
jgi:hypothetical protein